MAATKGQRPTQTNKTKSVKSDIKNNAGEVRPCGRPSSYTDEKACQLCALIAEGNSLVKAAKTLKLNKAAIYRWLSENPNFRDNYELAIKERADFLFEELDELESSMLNGEINVAAFRAVLENRKWRLSRMNPKKYGETAKIELSGAIDIATELEKRIKEAADG